MESRERPRWSAVRGIQNLKKQEYFGISTHYEQPGIAGCHWTSPGLYICMSLARQTRAWQLSKLSISGGPPAWAGCANNNYVNVPLQLHLQAGRERVSACAELSQSLWLHLCGPYVLYIIIYHALYRYHMNHLLPASTAWGRQMIQTEGELDNTLTVSGQAANAGAYCIRATTSTPYQLC